MPSFTIAPKYAKAGTALTINVVGVGTSYVTTEGTLDPVITGSADAHVDISGPETDTTGYYHFLAGTTLGQLTFTQPAISYGQPFNVYRIGAEDIMGVVQFDPSIEDLQPFIAAAEDLVTELCKNAPNIPVPYTAVRLTLIETWLAAHFLAIRDPRYTSETMGAASASYATPQGGMNLSATPYGQQAMLLDTFGGLAYIDKHVSQGKRAKVGIAWLGRCPSYARYRAGCFGGYY